MTIEQTDKAKHLYLNRMLSLKRVAMIIQVDERELAEEFRAKGITKEAIEKKCPKCGKIFYSYSDHAICRKCNKKAVQASKEKKKEYPVVSRSGIFVEHDIPGLPKCEKFPREPLTQNKVIDTYRMFRKWGRGIEYISPNGQRTVRSVFGK